jgi:hypothetical protein
VGRGSKKGAGAQRWGLVVLEAPRGGGAAGGKACMVNPQFCRFGPMYMSAVGPQLPCVGPVCVCLLLILYCVGPMYMAVGVGGGVTGSQVWAAGLGALQPQHGLCAGKLPRADRQLAESVQRLGRNRQAGPAIHSGRRHSQLHRGQLLCRFRVS